MDLQTESSNVNAPGCYASPSVFSHDSQVCQACPAFDACSAACIQTLQALRETINIEDILARHRRAKSATIERADPDTQQPAKPDFSKFLPSVKKPAEKVERKPVREVSTQNVDEATMKIIDAIPQKHARSLATKWAKSGVIEHIRTELAQGRNPFASQARLDHCQVVCDALLAGTVTRTALKKAFMSRLGAKKPWDETTASSHINIAMPALIAFDIAIETPEGFALNPRLRGDNV
jgi:hypothetical protein